MSASIFSLCFLCALPVFASQSNGSVIWSEHYAWGENLGWINFAPSYAGLTITDTAITGYVWSSLGWINFNPTNSGQGVSNTTEGVLGGSAWVAGLGWLDMTGITIDKNGLFVGTAGTEGSDVGRLSFDCDNCHVATDWRPLAFRTDESQTTPGAQQSAGFTGNAPQTSTDVRDALGLPESSGTTVESFNTPLVVKPKQSGIFLQTFGPDSVSVEVPEDASNDGLIIAITQHPVSAANYGKGIFIISGLVYDIVATDAKGNVVHTFNKPLKITLSIPEPLDEKNTGVYWYDETKQTWVAIPDAVFTQSNISFFVDHLTRFVVFNAPGKPTSITPIVKPESHFSYFYVLLLCIPIGLFLFRRYAIHTLHKKS